MKREQRVNSRNPFIYLFGTDYDFIEYDDLESTYTESSYIQELKNNVEQSVKTTGKSTKNGGALKKKYEAPTVEIEEMTPEKLEKMKKILEGKEKDDNEIIK